MKLSTIFLALMIVASCAAARSRPERPWRVEVSSSGGITGEGIGSFAVDSGGKIHVRGIDGRECSYDATEGELERIETLLGNTRPEGWRESYVPENSCCDRIEYALTFDEAGRVTGTRWLDGPPPAPKDLAALADAIVGGEKSIRAESAERCR